MSFKCVLLTIVACIASASNLRAQGWDVDARTVGVGGIGGAQNVFTTAVDEQRGDHSIVIPLGLIQLWLNRDVLTPSSADFNPVRAIEYGVDPVHFITGRSGSNAGARFVSGVRNSTLQPDLNVYRGFVPADMVTGGLIAPKWGHTFSLGARDERKVQGLYVGVGPYLSLNTDLQVDSGLRALLASDTPEYASNARFAIADRSRGQGAVAAAGGYRGRFLLHPDVGSAYTSDAVYVAVNANYLRGFRYEDIDLRLRLDTNQAGLLTSTSGAPAPLSFTRQTSASGVGIALDLATGITLGPLEMGVSAGNIANTMTWHGVTRREYSLGSLVAGTGQFSITPAAEIGDVRVELPVNYRGNASYRGDRWSALAEIARDFNYTSFRGGFEQRLQRVEMRGAIGYSQEQWLPSAGVSLAVAPRFWVDLGAFGTTNNIERQRRYAFALSLRFKPLTP